MRPGSGGSSTGRTSGQVNAIEPGQPARMYPEWGSWLAVEADYNDSGVFDSPFTEGVGI